MTSKVLMNRYQLKEKIGHGGMGQVYLAWDSLLHRAVAVKLMPSFDEQLKERYRREAASLASLSHPNIIKVYDVGEDAGVIFLVMEYIQGPTLQEIIKAKAPLPFNEGLKIIDKVLKGLGEVHRKGIIHRDIKPQNILVTEKGEVKLCDFGIAKVLTNETMTVTGMAIGTVQYMAPEQLMGGSVKPTSDIYSLGVILYEMFAGILPFNGNNIGEVAQKHFNTAPLPLSNINPNIHPDLEFVIMKCLAKNPKDRFQRVEEIQHLMEKIIEGSLKETMILRMKRNPTIQLPIYDNSRDFKEKNIFANYIKKSLNKIPLKKILSTALLIYLLIFGIHSLTPWLETKSKDIIKKSLLSELQKKVPILDTNIKPEKKTAKNEVEKVKNSLQTLQKDFKQGDQKIINDNLKQWKDQILTDKDILQKLEEKLNDEYSNLIDNNSLTPVQPKLNKNPYSVQKENLQKLYERLNYEFQKKYQKQLGKKSKRKHKD